MSVNLWRTWRISGFILILSIYFVLRLDTAEIDLIEDLSHLSSAKNMIQHSTVWSLDLTSNKGNNYLSQTTTDNILNMLMENTGFSLCVTFSQNLSNSGTIFSIQYQGRLRFLEIKVSIKRKVFKVLYFPNKRTFGYRTEKLSFTPLDSEWTPICVQYVGNTKELSLTVACKKVASTKLRDSMPSTSLENKTKYDFKVWLGQRASNQGLFMGKLKNMIFSNNTGFSKTYCNQFISILPPFTTAPSVHKYGISDRLTYLESEFLLLKQQLLETQKYMKQCQCFPQCVTNAGQIKYYDDKWMESPCHSCKCTLHGTSCQLQTCPMLSCSKNVTDAGKCCPRCPYNCQYLKNKYSHDQGFSIKCMDCHCNDGTLSCRRINPEVQCPKLKCHKFLQIKPKGQCCKKCKAFNMCELTRCGPNANCRESSFGCQCNDGFHGNPYTGCTDIDECQTSNRCPAYQECINTNGSYKCRCKPGYYKENDFSETCTANCTKNLCLNNSTCVAPDQCECKSGFTGPACDTDIDECRLGLIRCPLNAECLNIPGGYICQCKSGYQPITEDILSVSYDHQCADINECMGSRGMQNNCDKSSSCENIPGGFRCIPKMNEFQPFGSNCAIKRKNGEIMLMYDRKRINITETCKTCRCESGTLICKGIDCDCSSNMLLDCCPKCRQSRCDHDIRVTDNITKVNWLNCSLSLSNCTNLRCPLVTCNDPILLPGQCCQYCQSNILTSCIMAYNNLNTIVPGLIEYMTKCNINGVTHKSGQNIISHTYVDGSCIKCLCWDGHLCCGKSFSCTGI